VSLAIIKVGSSVAVDVMAQARASLVSVKQTSGAPVSFYVTDPAQFTGALQVPLGGQYTFVRAGGYAAGEVIGTVRLASGGLVDVRVGSLALGGGVVTTEVIPAEAGAGEVVVGVGPNGALEFAAGGGGGSVPRLDEVLDPTADKTFEMGAHQLRFNAHPVLGADLQPLAVYSYVDPLVAVAETSGLFLQPEFVGSGTLPSYVGVYETPYSQAPFNGEVTSYVGFLDDAEHDVGTFPSYKGFATLHGEQVSSQDTFDFYAGASSPFSILHTNEYGLFVADKTKATNSWAIKTGLGKVEFGDTLKVGGNIGFFNHAPAAKPTISGAKLPSDVVLANLLTALSGLGLLTDSTT